MARYLITRHPGAIEWARRRAIVAGIIRHLDDAAISRLEPGDEVIGRLPVHIVAALTDHGVRYLHIEYSTPELRRGDDLSADEMERYGARLVAYRAARAPD